MIALATDREVKWILSDAPFLFARYSRDLRYQYVSKAYAAMIGREPDEIVGKPMIDTMGSDRFEKIRPQVEAVLQGQRVEFEVEMNFSGVGLQRLRAIYEPEQDERGLVVGWFCSILDISESKQDEHDNGQLEQLLFELHSPQVRVGIWHQNLRTNSLSWTPELEAIYGLEAGSARRYADFRARVHPEDVDDAEERRDAAIRAGEQFELEYRIIRPDGQVRWLTAIGGAVYDTVSGAPIHILGNTIDITTRKQAELEKTQLAEKLSLALRAAGMGIWLIDLKTRRVKADSAAKILHGLEPDEPVETGDQARQNMHPDDIPEIRRKFWPAFETRGSFEVEYRVILPDGKIRWIAGRGEVPEGSPYLIGTLRDITDRKLAEARLADHASEERFRGIVSQMAAGVCRLAFNGTVTFANKKFCNMLGYDHATELVGKTFSQLAHSGLRPENLRLFERLRDTGEAFQFEKQILRRDGSTLWANISISAIYDSMGKPQSATAVILDVTARRSAEEALRKSHEELEARVLERTQRLETEMQRREQAQAALAHAQQLEAVGQLTGGVAHDINNMLAVVSGNLEVAMSSIGIENQRVLRALRQALDAVDTGANLNRKLLSFARQRKLEPVVLVLNDRVREVTNLLERTLGQQITLTTRFAADLWHTRVDPTEIDNALLNLALNARDAMNDGGTLSIKTRNVMLDAAACAHDPDARPGEYVRLSIVDTGRGMTPEVKRRAVEPFFTTKEAGKGTGLGLSSAFGFAKQSGGFLRIESKVGEGTAVHILLPRVAAEPAASLPNRAEVPIASGELILVVEDNDRVRHTTLRLLKLLGYSVLAARNGAEAVEILKGDAPVVLVFSDIVMPGGMSGYDVARWVRTMRPDLKVLLTSGYYDGSPKGAEGLKVLEKPYTRVQLSQAIREELAGDSNLPAHQI